MDRAELLKVLNEARDALGVLGAVGQDQRRMRLHVRQEIERAIFALDEDEVGLSSPTTPEEPSAFQEATEGHASDVESWGYRVFVRPKATGADDYEDEFFIGEVAYDADDNIVSRTDDVSPLGSSPEALLTDLGRMIHSFARPVVQAEE